MPRKIRSEGPRQSPDMTVEAGLHSRPDRRQQYGMFGDEPGLRLLGTGELLWPDAGREGRQRDGMPVCVQQQRGVERAEQIVVEHAVPYRPLLRRAFVTVGELDGVRAK